jgi:hypothetical protein
MVASVRPVGCTRSDSTEAGERFRAERRTLVRRGLKPQAFSTVGPSQPPCQSASSWAAGYFIRNRDLSASPGSEKCCGALGGKRFASFLHDLEVNLTGLWRPGYSRKRIRRVASPRKPEQPEERHLVGEGEVPQGRRDVGGVASSSTWLRRSRRPDFRRSRTVSVSRQPRPWLGSARAPTRGARGPGARGARAGAGSGRR